MRLLSKTVRIWPISITRTVIVALLAATPWVANAIPIDAGVFTQNNLHQCGASLCAGNDPSIQWLWDSDLGVSGSVATQVIGATPATQAATSIGYAGDAFTPAISAYAYTDDSVRFTLGVFGIQRYEFLEAGEITIDGSLTFSQTGGPSFTSNPWGSLAASFMAFQMVGDVFDPDGCNLYSLGGARGERNESGALSSCLRFNGVEISPGFFIEFPSVLNFQESTFATGTGAVTDGLATASLTVRGNANDVFFLAASMAVSSAQGGFMDSRNTLLLNIDQPALVSAAFQEQSFVPAPTRVPEPATLTLLCAGLLGIGMARRPRKR